jgi:predicted negative regulator of RcsB-dependent stress response
VAEDGMAGMTARAQDFLSGSGRNLAIGIGVVLVAAAGFFIFQETTGGAEKAASGMLAEARSAYTQGQVEQAAGTLTTLLQQHGGTRSGTKARLLMADVELRRNNPVAAEAQFRAALAKSSPSEYLWFNAQRGLAVSLENQSKFAEAATAFEGLTRAAVGNGRLPTRRRQEHYAIS